MLPMAIEEPAQTNQAKGLPEKQTRALVVRLIADRPTIFYPLVREELGVAPDECGACLSEHERQAAIASRSGPLQQMVAGV